jgi:hypothetical protein
VSEDYALVGIKPCGCATSAQVDDEQTTAAERREFYRDCAKERKTVERWTMERVRAGLKRCKCKPSEDTMANPHGGYSKERPGL